MGAQSRKPKKSQSSRSDRTAAKDTTRSDDQIIWQLLKCDAGMGGLSAVRESDMIVTDVLVTMAPVDRWRAHAERIHVTEVIIESVLGKVSTTRENGTMECPDGTASREIEIGDVTVGMNGNGHPGILTSATEIRPPTTTTGTHRELDFSYCFSVWLVVSINEEVNLVR